MKFYVSALVGVIVKVQKILFYNKFVICLYMFQALCAHHQEVKIVFYSVWYRHTYRWPPTGVIIPDAVYYDFDLLMMRTQCSKHVEEYNKLIIKQEFVH